MSERRGRLAVVAFAGLTLGATLLAVAQSVVPVRLDDFDEEAPALAPSSVGGIEADVLRLVPRDAPPFSCTPAELGSLYVQRDAADFFTSIDQTVCVCAPVENDPTTGFWKVVGSSNTDCSSLVAP
jgi:hypothetical protein